MLKKVIIFSLVFLSSCSNHKEVSCILEKDNKSINLEIQAINDDISSIRQRVVFVLPNDLLADENWLSKLNEQLDDSYHYEDNKLVSETDLLIDDTYSLNKTIEYLRKERFYCD